MGLKKNSIMIILSCALILIVLIAVFFQKIPGMITGFASIVGFPVTVSVHDAGNQAVIETVPEPEKEKPHLVFFSLGEKQAGNPDVGPEEFAAAEDIELFFQYSDAGLINEDTILLQNNLSQEAVFTITFSANFIYSETGQITIPAGGEQSFKIYFDTEDLEPGVYHEFIFVRSGDYEQKVNLTINILEPGESRDEQELVSSEEKPGLEQPALIKGNEGNSVTFGSFVKITILALILIVGIVIFITIIGGRKKHPDQKESL